MNKIKMHNFTSFCADIKVAHNYKPTQIDKQCGQLQGEQKKSVPQRIWSHLVPP